MTKKTNNPASKDLDFDFRTIKSFEDACAKTNVDPSKLPDVSLLPEGFQKPIVNAYKLMIIYLAINNGWVPDWSDYNQYKYYPYFGVAPSGAGFSGSDYGYAYTHACVGSRLCTDTSEKALYIGRQFGAEYEENFLYK
jgi:hypothetical protein